MLECTKVDVDEKSQISLYSDGVRILTRTEDDGSTLSAVAYKTSDTIGAYLSRGNYEIYNGESNTTLHCADGVISLIPGRPSIHLSSAGYNALLKDYQEIQWGVEAAEEVFPEADGEKALAEVEDAKSLPGACDGQGVKSANDGDLVE
jgi:hypothetical protein